MSPMGARGHSLHCAASPLCAYFPLSGPPYRLPADLAAYSLANVSFRASALGAKQPFVPQARSHLRIRRALRLQELQSVLPISRSATTSARLSSFVSRTVIGQPEQRIGKGEHIGATASILNLWASRQQHPDLLPHQHQNPNLESVMAGLFKIVSEMIRDLTGLYRPERHYMRGPGPAWRAKHPEA